MAGLQVVFSCPVCGRIFVPSDGVPGHVPLHDDPLCGPPCLGSGREVEHWLDLARA